MSHSFCKSRTFSATSIAALVCAAGNVDTAYAQTVINDGNTVTVTSTADNETISAAAGVTSTVNGSPVIVAANDGVVVDNAGTLRTLGVTQTIQANGDTVGVNINNAASGLLEAESRVVNIDGDSVTVNNAGIIRGTGNQRNGTIYANATANDFTINNLGPLSVIDAGAGNQGAGIALEIGNGGNPVSGLITNEGTINGRGQGAFNTGLAGDGIRFFGPGFQPTYEFSGVITNSGIITSEGASGPVSGVRFANRIGFTGTLENTATGTISGVNNGVYFGEADHTGGVVNNAGTISSDSRAFNIDGTGLTVNNTGTIIGTGNQRNGTIYADATAQNFTLNNVGIIDAGAGLEGAGFSVELSEGGNDFTIINAGSIIGRGNAGAGASIAGDGIRLERTRVGGALEGSTTGLFTGSITNSGIISSEGANGTVGGFRAVNGVSFQGTLTNEIGGVISGVQNGVYFGNPTPAGGGDHTGGVVNNAGTISSDSRAFNIDGTGLVINNSGSILATGNQRNGAVYADATAQDFTLNNLEGGVIDAGAGLEGAAFSVELSEAGNNFTIVNAGDITGRGNAAAGLTSAGDGLRFERTRVGGALDGTTTGLFTGSITNAGTISSEGANGTVSGIRFVNGTSFSGTLTNEAGGTISGVQNGVYFGNATPAGGGVFTDAVVDNFGTISSDSRAFNIDGTGLTVNNSGSILATGNQRNGTVYADATAQDFTLNNQESGIIDAGAGLEGAAFSVELSEAGNAFDIINAGTIQGRGQAGAGVSQAGDGLRFERTRIGGALDGSTTGLFTGTITNSGLINAESDQGTAAGIRFVNGTSFQGTLSNEAGGTISGVRNGLYFGNATPAGGGINSGTVNNAGTISSDSRALNIDGSGLTINNSGIILGTGNQRNGTIYADSTAQDFTLNNEAGGVIDAGAGLEGAGFSVELTEAGNDFTILNAGDIIGRGNAGAGIATAGDGLRFERTRVGGALDGSTAGLFTGDITNSGAITSEGANGTVSGIRFVNGTSFSGTLTNQAGGTISGIQNGVYFGNATPAGGGIFIGAIVDNFGSISSDSRAFNIDGTGLTINNAGSILGTGNQRNGTVYADGTANNYTINNLADGVIDAGDGNQGSGVSLQSGVVDGDVRNISITNAGLIAGRGDALPSGQSAGLRIFNGAGVATTVTINGDITNTGTISSETSAAILLENVDFTGTITNSGTLSGATAFDAISALRSITFVQIGGVLSGDFLGSAFEDSLAFASGSSVLAGSVLGGVNVSVADDVTVSISGDQTIEGNFSSNGILAFNLGTDSLTINGDTLFGAGSIINAATPDDITLLTLGTPITLVSQSGTFTNNGLAVNVADDDFLVDYVTSTVDGVSVIASATNLAGVSQDANFAAFGGALTTAFAAGNLQGDVANSLNDAPDVAGFEGTSAGLLPTINEGVTREIFETNAAANTFIDRRLRGNGTGAWVQALYRTANRDQESGSVTGYDADAFGFALGLDTKLSERLTAGVAFNYSSIDVDEEGGAGENSEIDAYQITAYTGVNEETFFANAQIGYAFSDVDTSRSSSVGNITGAFDLSGFTALATLGKTIDTGALILTPQATIHYANLSTDTYTESGGLDFDIDGENVSFLDLKAGFELSTPIAENGFTTRPVVRAAYVYDAIGDARVLNTNFNGSGSSFILSTIEPAQSRFEFGAGLEVTNGSGFSFIVEYDGELASGYSAHGGFLRARIGF